MDSRYSKERGQAKTQTDPELFTNTNYRLVSRLGAGAMGEVFVVEHRELGRDFVAKVLHAEFASDPRIVDRMRVERQALGRLDHPHVVSVVDSATLKDGRPFFVMERLRGHTLADELRQRGKLPVYEAVHFTCELLSALAATHQIGIVHRDIKPANLFVCTLSNGSRCLKVLDFGIARVLPDAPAAAPLPLILPTDVGVMMGTPRFASPEAAVGQRVDTRADLYAAALMLYLMLAGRGPFDHRAGAASVMAAHVSDEPAPPSTFAAEPVPYPLDQAVLRGLRKDPGERFQSAAAFKTELEGTVALLRKPLGWVETTVFPREKSAVDSTSKSPPEVAAVLDDSSIDGTTFQMPFAGGTPQRDGAASLGVLEQSAKGSQRFVLPFALGMLLAALIALIVVTVSSR